MADVLLPLGSPTVPDLSYQLLVSAYNKAKIRVTLRLAVYRRSVRLGAKGLEIFYVFSAEPF
jgi:hypothetical protein